MLETQADKEKLLKAGWLFAHTEIKDGKRVIITDQDEFRFFLG